MITIPVKDIDWPLLHRQKRILLTLASERRAPTIREAALLDGLALFLDEIQDQAVKHRGPREVFGRAE